MGTILHATASDGHSLSAYLADPPGRAHGTVVVVQEVFGVNAHIRDVCDRFAAEGWTAVAPALFDRIEQGVELDYADAGLARGRALMEKLGWDNPMRDIAAAAEAVAPGVKVGITGFCWGGSAAFLAACRITAVGAASAWYGRHIPEFADAETPHCPVILHYGEEDELIPPGNRAAVAAAYPDVPQYLYAAAGHGFNCDRRDAYREEAAQLAWERTLEFLDDHLR